MLHTLRSGLSHLVAVSAVLGLAGSSGAALTGFRLSVSDEDSSAGYFLTPVLGCTPNGDVSLCHGDGLTVGDVRLDSWNLTFDSDPVVSGPISVTNVSASTQFLTFIFTLPVTAIPGSTVTGGSIQGGMTDNDGDGAIVGVDATTGALYRALIDGATYQALYNPTQSFSAGSFLSGNVPSTNFGAPIPSQVGPAVNTSIGLALSFSLSPHDSAVFTSNFVVMPSPLVPEPASGGLLGAGLLALGIRSRRKGR